MSEEASLLFVEKQEELAPVAQPGSNTLIKVYESAAQTEHALLGVPQSNSLHAAITDVPVASWTAAAALDFLQAKGHDDYAPGADAAVIIGLAGTAASAITELIQRKVTHGSADTRLPPHSVSAHPRLTSVAAACYVASWVARRKNKRGLGRALGFVGYGAVIVSAYLGVASSRRSRQTDGA